MQLAETPSIIGISALNSATPRLWRSARERHRRVFCYLLALAPRRSEQSGPPSLAVRLVGKVPFGQLLRQHVRHRPALRKIPVSRLLMGTQAGLDSGGFADALGTLRYGSTPMDQSPHVELLRLAKRSDRPLLDEEIKATSYFEFARRLADTWGNYRGAETDEGIVDIARHFVNWSTGMARREVEDGGPRVDDHVLVAKVHDSSTFQVIDGHHRVAAAIAKGELTVRVHRTWLSTETALQWRLYDRGYGSRRTRSLDQPVGARELAAWTVAHNCQDRLVRMERLVERGRDETSVAPSFLDVGCGFGWYLAELQRLGWQVRGIDDDVFGSEVATAFHGLADDAIVVGEWAPAAESLRGTFEVVSCLGLGATVRSGDQAATTRLLHVLDERTGRALVAEARCSGEADATCPDVDELTALVFGSTSFSKVYDLGTVVDPRVLGRRAASSRLLAFRR
jgi:hypothetical protein